MTRPDQALVMFEESSGLAKSSYGLLTCLILSAVQSVCQMHEAGKGVRLECMPAWLIYRVTLR